MSGTLAGVTSLGSEVVLYGKIDWLPNGAQNVRFLAGFSLIYIISNLIRLLYYSFPAILCVYFVSKLSLRTFMCPTFIIKSFKSILKRVIRLRGSADPSRFLSHSSSRHPTAWVQSLQSSLVDGTPAIKPQESLSTKGRRSWLKRSHWCTAAERMPLASSTNPTASRVKGARPFKRPRLLTRPAPCRWAITGSRRPVCSSQLCTP